MAVSGKPLTVEELFEAADAMAAALRGPSRRGQRAEAADMIECLVSRISFARAMLDGAHPHDW